MGGRLGVVWVWVMVKMFREVVIFIIWVFVVSIFVLVLLIVVMMFVVLVYWVFVNVLIFVVDRVLV